MSGDGPVTEDGPVRDYEVGGGKPPKHTRFQKGRSGNPRGRPKGSQNNRTLLLAALDEVVIVTENGRQRRHTKRQIMFKQMATQLIQDLSDEGMHSVKPYTPEAGANKLMRMHAQTGVIENGLVFLPQQADWLDGCLHELTTFPAARNDDQVDSISQALHWAKNRPKDPGILTWIEGEVAKINAKKEMMRKIGHDI